MGIDATMLGSKALPTSTTAPNFVRLVSFNPGTVFLGLTGFTRAAAFQRGNV